MFNGTAKVLSWYVVGLLIIRLTQQDENGEQATQFLFCDEDLLDVWLVYVSLQLSAQHGFTESKSAIQANKMHKCFT